MFPSTKILLLASLLLLKIKLIFAFSSPSSRSHNTQDITRIGLLTSGGDCPSLNACIRAILKTAETKNIEVWGFPIGFPGLMKDDSPDAFLLDESFASTAMLVKGGSRLGGFVSADYTPVFDRMTLDQKAERVSTSLSKLGIDGIIATGGDSSLDRIATLLQHGHAQQNSISVPFIGIPKSIDNDIPETVYSLGFQSAVSQAAAGIANVRDTAESHRRIIVVECMGRNAGFLTLHAGLAGGADAILLPEFPVHNDELVKYMKKVYTENKCGIVAVSEAIQLPQTGKTSRYTTADGRSRLGGSAEAIARFLAESLNVDARHIVLGHLQRGGSPNAFDQVLATTLGAHAVEALCDGTSDAFVTWNGKEVENIPLSSARGVPSKSITSNYSELKAAQSMGIYCGSVDDV